LGTVNKDIKGDFSTPVVVFDTDDRLSLGVARSLGRLGVPVYGLSRIPRSPSVYSKFYKEIFFLPKTHQEKNEIVNNLVKIAQKIGKRAILLCTSDVNVRIAVEFSDELEKYFIFHKLPKDLADSILSKKQLAQLAKQYSISSPKTLFPKSITELQEYLKDLKFPVVLKIIEPDKEMIDWTRFFLVQSKSELLKIYSRHKNTVNRNYMIQEYIPNLPASLWMFDGYFNSKSECLFSATGFKIRQTPAFGGATSLGIAFHNEELALLAKQFMKKINYTGIVDIDFIYDQRDGAYKILDINPRIGATFRLFAGKDGFDVVHAQYLDLTDQFVPQTFVPNGRKWILENDDFFWCASGYVRGKLSLGQWLKSLIGVQEGAWFAVDDILPFFVTAILQVRNIRRGRWWTGMFENKSDYQTINGAMTI
jgi:D-aspartate ligase